MSSPQERFKAYLAAYLFLRDGDKLLMLRRANTGYMDGQYGVIQGHLEGGETAQECIAREAKEEAGIEVDLADVKIVHVQHSPAANKPGEYICIFAEATVWKGEPYNAEPEKCDDVAWFALNELPGNTIPELRRVLDMVKEGVVYSNEGWNR
jgi:ADP-ribose pyrophosphatase YjhB (NUDIX family)